MRHTRLTLSLVILMGVGVIASNAQQGVVSAGGEATAPSGESMSHSAGLTDYVFLQGEAASMQFGLQQVFDAWFTVPGDANCDGVVDVLDAIAAMSYYFGDDPQPFCFDNADVNQDGVIDVLDVIAILNIFLNAKTHPYPELLSDEAELLLHSEGMDITSDGTLAGLQFELTAPDIRDMVLEMKLSSHELAYVVEGNILRAMIVSFDNTPIPAGRISLVSISNTGQIPFWGEVLAANLNALAVPVALHRDETTQTPDLSLPFAYTLYPNPANKKVFIGLTGFYRGQVGLDLLNMQGQIMDRQYTGETGEKLFRFDVSGLPPGVYLLRITHQGRHHYEKIIKN